MNIKPKFLRLLKVIPQKEKLTNNCLNFPQMFPTNVCFENLNQTYLIYACTGASFHRFTVHFAAAGSKGF